jgi:membrane protease YdiL (CAAX protease family)
MHDPTPPVPPAPLSPTARLLIFAALVIFVRQFWRDVAAQGLLHSGFFASFYGPDFAALVSESGAGAKQQLALTRVHLWAVAVGFPFWAVSVAGLVRVIPGLTREEIGLTSRHLGRDLLTGLIGWAVLAPLSFGVNWIVVSLYQLGGIQGMTEEHPFTEVAKSNLMPAEWVPFVLVATMATAVYEELLFRGILQPLFSRHEWGGVAAMTGALVMMVLLRWDRIAAAYRSADGALPMELIPLGFVLATIPGFLAVWRFGRAPRAAGVYGTALLFATIHATVWPSPIGLFVFALGVGYLAERTGSLVGPIVVHTLFNGVTCVWLFVQWMQTAT